MLVLEIAADARRVIAWALTAAAVAALVNPAITLLDRYMPRALAVLVVVVVVLGSAGYVVYQVVDDVTDQTNRLKLLAPARAAELEEDSELLQEIELTDRVERLVEAIPERLRGGTTAEAIRSAANRGLALVVGIVLTLFFIAYGPRLVDGGFAQIRDERRRRRIERELRTGLRRGLFYARIKLGEVVIEGVLAYAIARAAGVPGPAAFGVWVALWTLLPIAGLFIGAVPIVAFAAAQSTTTAVLVALAFVAIGVGEWFITRSAERQSVHVGPFLAALAMFVGLELYGFMGALLLFLGAILAVAIVEEIGLEEIAEVIDGDPGPGS